MDTAQELKDVAAQEEQLQFERFGPAEAWEVGQRIRTAAEVKGVAVAIDIQLNGFPLFYSAMPGTSPNNADWVRRKRNTTLRFHKSSYAIGLQLKQQGHTLSERYGLPAADYVASGGSFPIKLRGTGCVGTITVSGLSQQEDHALIADAVTGFLKSISK